MDASIDSHPRMEGRRVRLMPIRAGDYDALRALEAGPSLGPTWRLRGATPGIDAYAQHLTDGVLAQFFVVDRGQSGAGPRAPLGLVSCYGPSMQDGHARIAVARISDEDLAGRFQEGIALFIGYVFACWPFRKLYADVAGYSLPQFRSLSGSLFEEEGVLRDHYFLNGRYWDQHILAIYRTTWADVVEQPLSQFLGRQQAAARPI